MNSLFDLAASRWRSPTPWRLNWEWSLGYDASMQRSYTHCPWMGLLLCIVVTSAIGCAVKVQPPSHLVDELSEWQEQVHTPAGISKWVTAGMRRSADPCNDFYEYACGRTNPMRVDGKPALITALMGSRLRLWGILAGLENVTSPNDSERRARDFFTSCVHRDWRSEVTHVKDFLHSVDQAGGLESIMAALGFLHRRGTVRAGGCASGRRSNAVHAAAPARSIGARGTAGLLE
jgi:hypothetical protein